MRRIFVPLEQLKDGTITVTGDDVGHIRDVLRMKTGDEITATAGRGITYRCKIKEFSKYNTNKLKITSNQFRHVCFNNNKLIIDNFGFQGILKEKEYYRPYHSITPCIKSNCIEVLDKCKDSIYKVIKAFRTKNQYNQYIYPVYENFNHRVDAPVLNYKYVGYENSLDEICMTVEDHTIDFICINDTYGNYRDEILKYKEYIKKSFNKRLGLK